MERKPRRGEFVSSRKNSNAHFGDSPVFTCQRCGQCCQGAGGIVLAPSDARRLAEHLGIGVAELLERYAEQQGGKQRLRVGADGLCVFFQNGCKVHVAKPDVCRAWPFFKGNLEDPYSLEMAKEYCPGIHSEVTFEAFATFGREFLRREGLLRSDTDTEARALCLDDKKS